MADYELANGPQLAQRVRGWQDMRRAVPRKGNMRTDRRFALFAVAALVPLGWLLPAGAQAKGNEDSPQISELLADVKSEAYQLKVDAEDMDVLARSGVSWESHAKKITMVKEHINEAGKMLAQLHDLKDEGSKWQVMAVERIDPLLRELAANTEKTIDYINNNQSQIRTLKFKEHVRSNYDLAVDLEALIRDFVDYGNAKERFDRIVEDKEVTG